MRAIKILRITVANPALRNPRPRCNGRSVLITTTRPIGVILKPISSATGAKVTLANSSAGLFWGVFPTGTPGDVNEIVRSTVSTKRNDERRGTTTSRCGMVVGLDLLVNPATLLLNPPRSSAAAQ